MFRLIAADPPADQVRRITFVPFLPDGWCALIESPDGPGLPVGEVLDGEADLIDAALRIPLQTAGFRYQYFRPFGLDGDHLYAWIEGGPYTGSRPHVPAELSFGPAERAARRFDEHGEPMLAAAVRAAAHSYRTLDEQTFYADNLRILESAYLRGDTPGKAQDSAATSRRGGKPAGTSPKTLSPTGRSSTSGARTGCYWSRWLPGAAR
jgi:hypothetical protein